MMADDENSVVMVGAFPPPVKGMPVINAAVRAQLNSAGVSPRAINLAASSLGRSVTVRLKRVPRVLYGLVHLVAAPRLRGSTFYISVSGGFGQLYEIAFVALARLRGMKLYLHHHSFSYLDAPSPVTRLLVKAAGRSSVHVTQSLGMGDRLKTVYGVDHVVPISNAVFLFREDEHVAVLRRRLVTLGFISNIAVEKGVFDFLDLMAAAREAGMPLRAKMAGPFQDDATERRVRMALANLPSVEYVGPKYGLEKNVFFDSIDAFVFPTRYFNETEGIVNHEAMSRGIPVIAYGRGCIPEIVGADCGLVIGPDEPFVPKALAKIESWLADSAAFEATSKAAAAQFVKTYIESKGRWQDLLNELIHGCDRRGVGSQGIR